jgi:hypothetical protein
MSYFRFMPVTSYRGENSGQYMSSVDITVRARILEYIQNSASTVVDYDIQDGERPEHLSHRIYGNPEYHWINLLYNEIHDPFFEWPMSNSELDVMVEKNYQGKSYFIDLNEASSQYTDVYFEVGAATLEDGEPVTITEWDANLYRVGVDSNSPGSATVSLGATLSQTRSDGSIISVTIKRVVDDNRYAVHDFVNADTGEVVDYHLVNADPTVATDLGADGVGDTVTNLSILQRYLEGAEQIPLDEKTVVIRTNYEYEISRNEQRRKIKVLRPEFVDIIVNDLKKVFFGG